MAGWTEIFKLTWNDQDKLIRQLIIISVVVHIIALTIDRFDFSKRKMDITEEMEIQADLVTDMSVSAPDKTTLPNAIEKPEPAAPANMLPQLTKKFVIPEEEKAADGEEPEEKKIEDAENDKNVKSDSTAKTRQDEEEKNKLKMQDALKRLALEKLRKTNEAENAQADKKDALARIKEELGKDAKPNAGALGLGSANALKRYRGLVYQAVRQHYALPEAYNLKNADLAVIVEVMLNEKGELVKHEIYQSSGDKIFDELALKAVKNAAPLPPPPKDQIGEPIHLQFTPRSM